MALDEKAKKILTSAAAKGGLKIGYVVGMGAGKAAMAAVIAAITAMGATTAAYIAVGNPAVSLIAAQQAADIQTMHRLNSATYIAAIATPTTGILAGLAGGYALYKGFKCLLKD